MSEPTKEQRNAWGIGEAWERYQHLRDEFGGSQVVAGDHQMQYDLVAEVVRFVAERCSEMTDPSEEQE